MCKIRTVCVSVTIVFRALFSLVIIFVDKVALCVFQHEHLSVFPHMSTEQLFVIKFLCCVSLYCSNSATICTLDAIVNSLRRAFSLIWSCLSDVSILCGL